MRFAASWHAGFFASIFSRSKWEKTPALQVGKGGCSGKNPPETMSTPAQAAGRLPKNVVEPAARGGNVTQMDILYDAIKPKRRVDQHA